MPSVQMLKLAALNNAGTIYDKAPLDLELPAAALPLFQQKREDIQAALAHYELEVMNAQARTGLGGGVLAGILTKLITTLIGSIGGGAAGGGTTPPSGGGTVDPNTGSVIVAAVMDFINKVLLPMFSNGTWGGSIWGPLVATLLKTLLPSILSGIIGAMGTIVPNPGGGTQTPLPAPLPNGFIPY